MVRHFGVFEFHPDVDDEAIDECFRAMQAMVGQIPGLTGFAYGPYDSSEGLQGDFTYGFIMTFDSISSRDAYLSHPIHDRVKAIVIPRLKRVMVFDVEASPD